MTWYQGMGYSPSPGRAGKPAKKSYLARMLLDYLREEDPKRRKVRAAALIESLYETALKGNMSAHKLIWSYCEGRPAYIVEILDQEIDVDDPKAVDAEVQRIIARIKRKNKTKEIDDERHDDDGRGGGSDDPAEVEPQGTAGGGGRGTDGV
jgi:hypothetical protein